MYFVFTLKEYYCSLRIDWLGIHCLSYRVNQMRKDKRIGIIEKGCCVSVGNVVF